jgi:hypothetical protein
MSVMCPSSASNNSASTEAMSCSLVLGTLMIYVEKIGVWWSRQSTSVSLHEDLSTSAVIAESFPIGETLQIKVSYYLSRSHWPRGQRRRSAATRLLRLWAPSRRKHGCLCLVSFVCCQVEVSATGWSLVQRSTTECEVWVSSWSSDGTGWELSVLDWMAIWGRESFRMTDN